MITSAEDFVRLRTSQNPEEYERAANEEADEGVWQDVIAHYPDMKRWVAHNKTVPLDILRLLATDSDVHVRYFVAQKRKLDRHLFAQLAEDPNASVRHRIACNAKAPRELLVKLSQDEEGFVAEAALNRL